ncbi:hypothetical protein CAL7716_102910 (plasmid) [Calothrix sp. PCC 7716]|nr:hypothetical protein CAL7716_102910 [Calothrix sp. PCC 7716]
MIYYQTDNSNIAFAFDIDLNKRIVARLRECGKLPLDAVNIMAIIRGGLSLVFNFNVVSSDIILLTVNDVSFSEKSSTLKSLIPSKTTWDMYYERKNQNNPIIFNIDAEIYPYLMEWKNWNVEEALTSRYSYGFSLDCSIIDSQIETFQIYDQSSRSLFHMYRDDYYGEVGHNIIDNPTWQILK